MPSPAARGQAIFLGATEPRAARPEGFPPRGEPHPSLARQTKRRFYRLITFCRPNPSGWSIEGARRMLIGTALRKVPLQIVLVLVARSPAASMLRCFLRYSQKERVLTARVPFEQKQQCISMLKANVIGAFGWTRLSMSSGRGFGCGRTLSSFAGVRWAYGS